MFERIKRVPGWAWMGLGLFLLLMARACAAFFATPFTLSGDGMYLL